MEQYDNENWTTREAVQAVAIAALLCIVAVLSALLILKW
jgi:hypothetical protein